METKTERNCRVQKLYDELMAEGKRGHYETMFRIVRLEVEAEREACALVADLYENTDMAGRFIRMRSNVEVRGGRSEAQGTKSAAFGRPARLLC